MQLNTASINIVLFLTLIFITPVSASMPEKKADKLAHEKVISEVIKAYGGEKVIKSINTIYAKGKTKALMRGLEGTYTRYFKRNRKLRVETVYSLSSEVRILNGTIGWRGNISEPLTQVSGVRYLAMAYQYKQLDLPYGLLKRNYRVIRAGNGHLNNKLSHVLDLLDNEGPPLRVYIDPDTFYIVKVIAEIKKENATAALSAEFSDFRIIDGVPLPHRILNYAVGHKVGETVIEEYSINPSMDDKLFKP
jgi:hypothetical protein